MDAKNKSTRLRVLLKATDVARILNISKSFAYQIMSTNELRTVQIGYAKRVRVDDLENFIEINTQRKL